jgi:hypothetical protein
MVDRYAGDMKTQLSPMDRTYQAGGFLVIPMLNVFSLLAAKNTDSVARIFYGKGARDLSVGVTAFVEIDPVDAADGGGSAYLLDETGAKIAADDSRITVLRHVARVKKGSMAVPSLKDRPTFPRGWQVRLNVQHAENQFLSPDTLKSMLSQGGVLGLGTFRPIFGRYAAEFGEWIQ